MASLLLALPARADTELPAFKRLKSLEGHWIGKEKGGWRCLISYDIISGGAGLRETLTMGNTASMVSVYHADGDQLMITHFCLNRTQSRMRTKALPPGFKRFDFEYWDATNVLQATDGLMNSVRIELGDADHFTQTWNAANTTDKPVVIEYARVRAPRPADFKHRFEDTQKQCSKAFLKLKTLAGEWRGRNLAGEPHPNLKYEIVSGGNALMESLDYGQKYQMVTMYHQDGDQLMVTHFCASNTQPRMRTTTLAADLSEFDFKYKDATNVMQGSASYMNHLFVRFQDADHFTQVWNPDSAKQQIFRFAFERKKQETASAPKSERTSTPSR